MKVKRGQGQPAGRPFTSLGPAGARALPPFLADPDAARFRAVLRHRLPCPFRRHVGLRAGADPLLRRQGGESSRAREPSERLRETRAADLARAPDTQLKAQENEGEGKLGAGGMADTRDPEPFVNESDKRQSISQAPSFEVRDARVRARARARATHRTTPFTATATPRRTGVPQAAHVNTPSRIALHLALYDAGAHTRPAVCRSALGGKGGRA